MKLQIKQELPSLIVALLPFAYLIYSWNSLPKEIPTHWNVQGEIDGWGSKTDLVWIVLLSTVFVYALLLILPKIDPKKNLDKMGNKYHNLKLSMLLIMSAIAIMFVYSAGHQNVQMGTFLPLLMGFLFMVLGNYFKTIKPNYFVGIRTPWTLESETVWKDTHTLSGKIWFLGGLAIVAASLVFETPTTFKVLIAVTIVLAIIPILYSYLKFNKLKNNGN